MPQGTDLEDRILIEARRLGFDLAGISPARPAPYLAAYRSWLAAGYNGVMGSLARPDSIERRQDLNRILPNAKSIISVAINYYPGDVPLGLDDEEQHGTIARYAWGDNYHDLILDRLEQLANSLQATTDRPVKHRAYVDTGPLLERAHAAEAGLGFIGKNACLINPRLGSWLLLGELLVDIDLMPTRSSNLPSCGTCRRCLDACPTGALVEPYVVDARRCVSYLTNALKGSIPRDLRPLIGERIFGCDECQAICPWQRFAQVTSERAFLAADDDRAAPQLHQLLDLDEASFRRRYEGTVLMRLGRVCLQRNVAVALGNTADARSVGSLKRMLGHTDPLVRSHAAWALGRIRGEEAIAALESTLSTESNDDTREEIRLALEDRL